MLARKGGAEHPAQIESPTQLARAGPQHPLGFNLDKTREFNVMDDAIDALQQGSVSSMSFFAHIGIAGHERLHTQTIAWLLTPGVSPLAAQQRKALLRVFGIECPDEDIDALCVQTELHSLDLVCVSLNVFLVLENKFKSRQSSQQLARYDIDSIPAVQKLFKLEQKARRVFMTFSREPSASGWLDVDYAELVEPLNSAAVASKNQYVVDYAAFLKKLVGTRDAFIDRPELFPAVFERVSWPAAKRLLAPLDGLTQAECFVFSARLERIFVEALLRSRVAHIRDAVVEAGAQGLPLVQVPLWLTQFSSGAWYSAGLQLQGRVLKLNIACVDYQRSKPSKDLEALDAALKSPERTPRKGTSRDYRSWIWPAPNGLATDCPPHCRFSAELAAQVASAARVWETALETLKALGTVVGFERWSPERAMEFRSAKRVARTEADSAQRKA